MALSRAAISGLLALLATVPFLIPLHHNPIPSFYQEWWAFFLGTSAAFIATLHRPLRIAVPGLAALPGFLLLMAIGQWFCGIVVYREALLFHGGYLAWAGLLLTLGATLRLRFGAAWLFNALATATLVGSLFSAVLGIMQYTGFPLPSYILFRAVVGNINAITANIAQPNLLASYLWIGIAATVYLVTQGRLAMRAALPAIIALGFTAGLSLSRVAVLEGFLLLVIGFIGRRKSETGWLKRRNVLVMGGLIALAAGSTVLKMWPVTGESTTAITVLDRLSLQSISTDTRIIIWRETLSLIADHPWLGNGVGNYPWRMVEAAAKMPAGVGTYAGAENAHNALLQVAADFGLPALLACLFLLLRWACQIRLGEIGADQWAVDILAIIGLHSLVEYPLWNSEFLGLAALAAGAIAARPKMTAFPESSKLLRIGLAGAVLALVPLRLDYGALDEATNFPPQHHPSPDEWRQRIQVVAHLATHSGLGAYANIALGALLEPDRKLAREQSVVCERAMGIWPDPIIVTRCAVLRLLDGKDNEADALISTLAAAFRDEKHRQAVSHELSAAEKKNPEVGRLGVLWEKEKARLRYP